uniref:Uncharacterized protein n=1 Tax=Leersia perrieri TaxID=77586 RepID=A0A0D9V3Z3_9ORYZ
MEAMPATPSSSATVPPIETQHQPDDIEAGQQPDDMEEAKQPYDMEVASKPPQFLTRLDIYILTALCETCEIVWSKELWISHLFVVTLRTDMRTWRPSFRLCSSYFPSISRWEHSV